MEKREDGLEVEVVIYCARGKFEVLRPSPTVL
jgi:hypothetical protein